MSKVCARHGRRSGERPQGGYVATQNLRRRVAPGSVRINANVRCERIYPTESTRKTVGELKTVGFRLSREQAIHLARVLLAVSQEWADVDVTGIDSPHARATEPIRSLSRAEKSSSTSADQAGFATCTIMM